MKKRSLPSLLSVFGTSCTQKEWESDPVEEVTLDESQFESVEIPTSPSVIAELDALCSNDEPGFDLVEEVTIDGSQSVLAECKTIGKWLSQLA